MRVENPDARDYYIREAAEQGWNTRLLERNISTLAFERCERTYCRSMRFGNKPIAQRFCVGARVRLTSFPSARGPCGTWCITSP
jgi:hypothetical protein